MTRRVFFALWPTDALRAAALRLREAQAAPGRDVPRSHLHLTLAFAGRVDEVTLATIKRSAAALAMPAFDLRLDRLDGFDAAGVQWLGPARPPRALLRLAQTLRAQCRAAGLAVPEECFRPHLTLRRGVREPARLAAPPIDWPVKTFCLIESGSDGRPGAYRLLARWRLAGAGT